MSSSTQGELELQLRTIITAKFPSFIFIRDTSSANVAQLTLRQVSSEQLSSSRPVFAFVDCIACFTQRLLFDSILYDLLDCCSESDADAKRAVLTNKKNDIIDDFLHNIRALFPNAKLTTTLDEKDDPLKIILVLEHAERLKETLPRLIHPLSRLQELTELNIATIFISEDAWDSITPTPGTLVDPYIIEIDKSNREDTIKRICAIFPTDTEDAVSMYNSSLEPLFRHFVEAVFDVCSPFVSDPIELAYIVAARWPGFVSPVLEDWKHLEEGPFVGPSEAARIQLLRIFNPTLMNAVENLYPRSMERTEWSTANSFPMGFGLDDLRRAQLPSVSDPSIDATSSVSKLPVLSMFILMASFLASYNPAKTDYRMFGRSSDEKSRRRRKGGGTRKTKSGAIAKVSQRLVGPMSFSYDRLVAILGSLLREYDDEIGKKLDDVSELKVEVDVYRVQTSASIRELVSMHLLHRATAQEKLEGVSFRCGIGYDQALLVARRLEIPLNELMWEPN
ncbi:hypothetical protein ACEPAG_9129 [Sanghuangporus baumii]